MNKLTTARLTTILSRLDSAPAPSILQTTVEALRSALRASHVSFCTCPSPTLGTAPLHIWGSTSTGWSKRYAAMGHHRADPVLIEAYQRVTPIDWANLEWRSPAAQALFNDALAQEIGPQGLTIPAHGPSGQLALLTINSTCDDAIWSRFTRANRFALILAAHALHHKVTTRAKPPPDPGAPRLSPREKDVITLLSRGDSRGQIATKLAISEHTLRSYIENARHKLGAVNTPHAVARAISAGIIPMG
ncbi:helix-turn-helix transcriptional regulator [Roseovarius sp. C7]|uniref:helix-turn-helix transcriptional regulator n=1 Tax=Roseovarius sp. C7 TaxID=3398643 RepID=UPI0039F73671